MKNKKFWIGIGISVVFLYFALKNIEIEKVLKAFGEINYIYIFPVILFSILTYIVRAWRWRYFFRHIKPIPFSSLFSATMIGFMANNILPARIGELVRAYCIGKKENISKSMSFATIVLERIFDGFSLFFLFVIILIFYPFPEEVRRIGYLFAAVYLIAAGILISVRVWSQQTMKIINFLCFRLPKPMGKAITEYAHSFISGLDVLKNGWDVFLILFYSIVLWTISAISFYFMLSGCHLQLSFLAALFVLIVVAIGIAIPAAPGSVGTFQYFTMLGLAVFGIDKNIGLTFSIVLHIIQIAIPIFIGWIYLCKEQISFGEIRE
ncbi:MAG: lysylphosphatidylglycerol synthase transmembrane domain-containing protein [bacterium]|nr:lysylphosphatidylglycerol synthase transmembrane domain-containing protein [bacterium]